MIQINNNQFIIQRGDNGTALLKLVNVDRTPYIMPSGMEHPFFAFVVTRKTKDLHYDDELILEKYMTLPITGSPVVDAYLTEYQFDYNIYSYTLDEHTEFTSVEPYLRKVYYKEDGSYVYFRTVDGELIETGYEFVLNITFQPGDTAVMLPGQYKYNLALLDSHTAMTAATVDEAIAGVFFKDDILGTNEFVVKESAYV